MNVSMHDELRLQFTNIIIDPVERMEPEKFDPDVTTYVVYRKKDSPNVKFRATLNAPYSSTSDDGYEAYRKYDLRFVYRDYRGYWFPCQTNDIMNPASGTDLELNNRESTVWFSIEPRKAYRDHLSGSTITITFKEIVLSEEEKANCTHPRTYTCEGECWGGASGSSSVEILTYCSVCDVQLSKTFDYRN